MTVGEKSVAAMRPAECRVTIRFPQVDPAGIVFYPRYFEAVARCFPVLPFAEPPFAIRTRFLKPNRLGDRLDIRFAPGDDWSITGRMEGHEYFSMRPIAAGETLPADARRRHAAAFRSPVETVGDWACGTNGRMQLSRYFEFLNMAIEQWLEDSLQMPFPDMHLGRRVGIPTVQFDTHCRRLPSAGETVSTWIRPVKLGDRALTFMSWFVSGDECLVENRQVVVFVRMLEQGYESMPIPDDMRACFARQTDAFEERT